MFQGIAIDQELTDGELSFLRYWLDEHRQAAHRHPFNEIVPVIEHALEDNIITEEEQQDILWLCDKIAGRTSRLDVTASIQRLHGILGGIIADAKIEERELQGLREWLDQHAHIRTCWPYDEVDALVTSVMADGKIDDDEHRLLLQFFTEFVSIEDDKTVTNPLINIDQTVSGICSCCPEIEFPEKTYCFTGAFSRYTRNDVSRMAKSLGAKVLGNVSKKVDYLVIGSEGNPCWAYACYGRKVEYAVNLRKGGHHILLVHENDFLDALA